MKLPLYFILLCTPIFVKAQNNCRGYPEEYVFNPNKIQAFFSSSGGKFYGSEYGGFNAPFPFPNYSYGKHTITAGDPWIGSFTDGKLYIAGQRYSQAFSYDYYNGPLDSNGLKFIDECHLYDRVWNVFREDVLRHVADFQDDGKIDDTIPGIFGWPAEGNPFFSRFNGFQLPQAHQGGWATFIDHNLNGIYDPHLGEYPAVMFQGALIHPDQIMWMVFNDQGSHLATHGRPLSVEMQLTVFGYYCEDNTLLNHSLFNSYKIINQSNQTLDSLFFGQFHDYEIGCDEDDYVGCDSVRNTEFAYNADSLDGQDSWCNSGAEGYGSHTPIQSLTYLSHPMYSYIKETNSQVSQVDIEFYRMLTGHWRNGAPITIGGNGQGTDPGLTTTRFIYPGDPRDPDAWSELAIGATPARTSSISSVYLDQLEAGDQTIIECVYVFHQDTTLSYTQQMGAMYANVDKMTDMVSNLDNFCESFPSCIDQDCVWPGDFNHDDIVDHRDLLYWGVTEGSTGPQRNGLVSWRGHFADDWSKTFSDDTNAKHQDADGDGMIGDSDLQHNLNNFFSTTPDYTLNDRYPAGPELVIVSDPMEQDGDIGNLRVMSRRPLKDIYGMAFELEFDTFYYDYSTLLQRYPLDSQGVSFVGDGMIPYYNLFIGEQTIHDTRYSYVGTSHENHAVEDSFYFLRIPFGLKQKHQLPLQYLPDQFVFRLKNLVAINKDGDDLDFGSVPYIVYNPFTTAVDQLEKNKIKVFPNPCHDEVMIVSDVSSDVEVVNVQGKKVRTIFANELSIPVNIDDLVPGMYFLRFVQTHRMVKLVVQ